MIPPRLTTSLTLSKAHPPKTSNKTTTYEINTYTATIINFEKNDKCLGKILTAVFFMYPVEYSALQSINANKTKNTIKKFNFGQTHIT